MGRWPQIGYKTSTSEGYYPSKLTMEPFRCLRSRRIMIRNRRKANCIPTLGFSRPYGSSSLGLKTLNNGSKTEQGIRAWYVRNGLYSSINFRSSKVRSRRAFRDHFGMDSLINSMFHWLDDPVPETSTKEAPRKWKSLTRRSPLVSSVLYDPKSWPSCILRLEWPYGLNGKIHTKPEFGIGKIAGSKTLCHICFLE